MKTIDTVKNIENICYELANKKGIKVVHRKEFNIDIYYTTITGACGVITVPSWVRAYALLNKW